MRLTVSVLFAIAAVAQNPPAPQVDASRAAQQTEQTKYHSARMRESQAAMQVINSTNAARTAVSTKDTKSALDQVNQALNSSRELDKMDKKKGKVPVYSEVVSVSVYTPEKVIPNGKSANAGTANQQQAGSADRTRAVQEVAAEHTNVYLDTTSTTQHLQDAQSALQRGDMEGADAALATVQKAVTTQAIGSDMPLLKARENLVLAARQAREANYAAAQATLNATVQALLSYADNGGAHEAQARETGREIDMYAQRIQENHNGAPGKIETWWDRVASWSEPGVTPKR